MTIELNAELDDLIDIFKEYQDLFNKGYLKLEIYD